LDIPTDAKGFLGSEQQSRAPRSEDLGETAAPAPVGPVAAADRDDRGRGERSLEVERAAIATSGAHTGHGWGC
jgi:hypothetical protein